MAKTRMATAQWPTLSNKHTPPSISLLARARSSGTPRAEAQNASIDDVNSKKGWQAMVRRITMPITENGSRPTPLHMPVPTDATRETKPGRAKQTNELTANAAAVPAYPPTATSK